MKDPLCTMRPHTHKFRMVLCEKEEKKEEGSIKKMKRGKKIK